MKKVFVSTSFAHVIDATSGKVLPSFRSSIEGILKSLRHDTQAKVYCPLEDEGWQTLVNKPAEIGLKHDMQALDEADTLLALVHDQPTAGAEFEIGYFVAKRKPVVLAMEAGKTLAHFNQALVAVGLVTLITYDNAEALAKQLTVALNAPAEPLAAATA